MERILGYFIFVVLGDGVLAAKFAHTEGNWALSESVTLLDGAMPPDPFIGRYASVWLDTTPPDPITSTEGRLRIFAKPNSRVNQYLLEWRERDNGAVIYWGEGMVYNNVLSGAYWGSRVNVALPRPH